MPPSRPRIVVAEPYATDALARLRNAGEVIEIDRSFHAELTAALADAEALLVRSYLSVTADLLEAAPRLRVIGRAGVGLENVDLETAGRRGIAVVYAPAAATGAVAEHTVALILALERNLVAADRAARTEHFHDHRRAARYRELGELTLGIIGMGRIGSEVARICANGFGTQIMYNDVIEVGPFTFPATCATKSEIHAQADVISLHVPLTDQTRAMVDAEVLGRLKRSATLVNTARGAIIDQEALALALTGGRLAGAALDVFDPEPLPPSHPLLSAPNLILTPHTAARSRSGLERMNDVVDDVIAVLQGRDPRFAAAATR